MINQEKNANLKVSIFLKKSYKFRGDCDPTFSFLIRKKSHDRVLAPRLRRLKPHNDAVVCDKISGIQKLDQNAIIF